MPHLGLLTNLVLAASVLIGVALLVRLRRKAALGLALVWPLGAAAVGAAAAAFESFSAATPISAGQAVWVAALVVTPYALAGVAVALVPWRHHASAMFAAAGLLVILVWLGSHSAIIALVAGLLGTAILGGLAPALSREHATGPRQASTIGLAVVVGVSIAMAFPLYFFADLFYPDLRRESWQFELRPESDDTPFALRVPFPSAGSERPDDFPILRDALEFEGTVTTWSWQESGTVLLLEGRGPIRGYAEVAFYGREPGHFEPDAFANATALLTADRPLNATLEWSADIPRGCWWRTTLRAELESGQMGEIGDLVQTTRICAD